MLVYRYLPAEFALASIERRELKLGRLDRLNDVHDCRPNIVNFPREFLPQQKVAYVENLKKQIAKTTGILCFCRTPRNLLVWSHYGKDHSGIALGFEMDIAYGGKRVGLEKVHYPKHNGRATFPYFAASEFTDSKQEAFKSSFYLRKGRDWRYEEEYRTFCPLKVGSIERDGMHFVPFLPHSFKSVILGERCRLDPEFVRHVSRFRHNPSDGPLPSIFRAVSVNTKYAMRLVRVP